MVLIPPMLMHYSNCVVIPEKFLQFSLIQLKFFQLVKKFVL